MTMAHSDKRAILLKALALAAAGAVIWAPTAYADDPANPDETQQNEDEQDKRDDAADQAQSAIDQAKDAVDQANQAAQQNQQSEHDKKFGATGGLMHLINGVPTCAHAGDSYTNVEVVVMQPITPC
ncbi:hypothetical protein [Mycolicibacterium brumae]|uniref:DUF732 domain-containing protein n=1 Tax=Mycolicibacterium brumae TaxID=85968 RepID=A0A2G5P8Z9_9MYCO|nr:hypothetical protein [Mycolicibacterium brumae]MCV7193418.1 hypothetical protein [Mycolicibacterium brumae]PIB74822.1 hypothetical protein CQY22_011940 [Mycolicibacterium brumae]UWW07213.1 hypothetical protein L2Z93_000209 [Mycolicibacterium brumae]